MVLIDGDGLIVSSAPSRRDGTVLIQSVSRRVYLQRRSGGRRAASQLDTAVQNWIENEATDVPLNARVICRIYANVRGLGEVLVRTGAINHIGVFQEFVQGFTRAKTMFDFIDVGSGKDRADEKIIGG